MDDGTIVRDELIPVPEESLNNLILEFRANVPTLEASRRMPFMLLQDGKSLAYYIECHLKATDAIPLVDLDAVLDPEEQEQFRLQRELQVTNSAFIRMCADAVERRQFADIIAEYDSSYRPETPLKILGGQHRIEAIKRALEGDEVSRYHGFRIYFGLTTNQRNEIAQVANTNIAISLDLLDRMQETVRGPQLRNYCHEVGLLDPTEDFADRKNPDGKITVRLARTFVVDFYEGKNSSGSNIEQSVFVPYVCKSGQEDSRYLTIIQKDIWKDGALLEAGTNFAELHRKQFATVKQDPELDNPEFRNKAISMAVLSSWAFTAGLLQGKPELLQKLYSLPRASGGQDPLNAKAMSESKHPKDPTTYRGLGTRFGTDDRGRITEMFIQYSTKGTSIISKKLIESAIMRYEAKVALEKADEAEQRVS